MAMIEFVGVDGCPAGWFGVGFDRYGGYEVNVFSSFGELLDRYRDAGLVLVDIPIGLPEGPERRECDSLARKLLGRRGSSVFPSPTRQTVEHAAAHPKDYRGALAVERRFAGKGISRQAFRDIAKDRRSRRFTTISQRRRDANCPGSPSRALFLGVERPAIHEVQQEEIIRGD